jgi:hypothetical protein
MLLLLIALSLLGPEEIRQGHISSCHDVPVVVPLFTPISFHSILSISLLGGIHRQPGPCF